MEQLDEQSEIRKYLLNDIGEKEREAIEERLLADDEYFEEISMAEENLIQDYVDENLGGDERERFQKYFLSSEENRRKVQFARALRKYVNETKKLPDTEKKHSFFDALRAFFFAPVPAAFAVLIIVAVTGFLVWKNYSSQSDILVALNKVQKNNRPTEARITGFEYAPKVEGTRGGSSKDENLDLISAKARATEAVLKNETPENLHELGRVYLTENNFDEAIKYFEKALKKNPNIAKIHNDLGAALMEKGKQKKEGSLDLFAKANEEIEKAIELDKNLTEAYFNRALAAELLNSPNQAEEAWKNYLNFDSSSKWATEAREHLRLIETNKPVSKTKEEILQDFLEAKALDDKEKAWQTISRNREMITGKLIPQQLAFLFVDAKAIGDNSKAGEYLEALDYAGKLEKEKSGDLFWQDLSNYYSNISDDKIITLKDAQDSVRKGYELCRNDKYEEASREFQKARDSFRRSQNIWEEYFAKYWISYFLFLNNEVYKSNDLLYEVENFSQARNYKWLLSQALGWLAVNANSLNKLSKSIEYDKKAIKYSEEVSELYNLQKILSQTSDHYQQVGQFSTALDYAQKGLELGVLPETSLRQKWRDYDAVSDTFKKLKFYKTSEIYEKEALKLAVEVLDDNAFKWTSYTDLALIYAIQGKYAESSDLLNEGRKVAEKFEDAETKNKNLAYINLQLANSSRQQNKCSEAIADYDKALEFYASAEYKVNEFEARKGKLNCYLIDKDYFAFQKELPVILSLFDKYRSEILEEQNRNSFFDNEQSVYDLAIDYESSAANISTAFDYSEESRSRSLLDLQKSIVKVSKEEKNQPEIKFLSNVYEPLKLSQIQAEMAENVQLLEYTVLNNKVLIWLITKNNVSFAETDISLEVLQEKVLSYLDLVSNNAEPNKQLQLGSELYELLISPIKENLDKAKEICLVPDKILFHLPFATLFAEKYFIEQFSFFYSPSANVFIICSKKARALETESSETILSIGNPYFDKNNFESLPELPSAAIEAKEVAKFYDDSIIFTEKEASKQRVQETLKKANVIHFAVHYVINETSPLLSSLILAGNKKEESSLANYEIIGEKLSNARLIVLSACQTGVEKYYNGEGMIGASRTFLAAGVPLVVASQWNVDSEATAKLMTDFHRYRKIEKLSTAEALRRSQLDMLNDKKFQQPYYWAAFTALGGYSKF